MTRRSTDPGKNPNLRQTNARTYFSAIWDTINLSDFFIEIWASIRFFFDFTRRRPGTHGQHTKLQKTSVRLLITLDPVKATADPEYRFLPHTIDSQEKMPLSSMDHSPMMTPMATSPTPPRRSPSGNHVNDPRSPASTASYQKTGTEQSNAWRPSDEEAANVRTVRAPLYANPKPNASDQQSSAHTQRGPPQWGTPQWGDSYSATQPFQHPASASGSRWAISAAPPAAFPDPQPFSSTFPPFKSPNSATHGIPITSPSYHPPGIDQTATTHTMQLSPPSARTFPSPHPTGSVQPTSAVSGKSIHTLSTQPNSTGSSHYATPAQTPGEIVSEERGRGAPPWYGEMERNAMEERSTSRPQSGIGIPGNPRLF